jgi:prepilin signal peptidase PulO-like enzyme (type II secretory pathway)
MIVVDLFVILLGLVLGSFIYTMATRLQSNTSLWIRSRCDHCSRTIGWLGLVPVVGFLLQKGKCSYCRHTISPAYPLAEIINAIMVWLILGRTGLGLSFIHMLLMFESLFLVALIDFQSHRIYPHPVLIGLAIQSGWLFSFGRPEMLNALFGLLLGAGVFHWVAYLYHLIRKKEGLGAGDATLLGLIGFIFGWQTLFPIVFWGSALGITGGGLILLSQRQSLKHEIAFGPWLVLAAFLVWRFSDLLQNLPWPVTAGEWSLL